MLPPSSGPQVVERSMYGVMTTSVLGGLVLVQMERRDGLEGHQWRVNLDFSYGPWTARVYDYLRFVRPTRRHKWKLEAATMVGPPLTNSEVIAGVLVDLPRLVAVKA